MAIVAKHQGGETDNKKRRDLRHVVWFGTSSGIRTRDLHLERVSS